MQENVRRFKSLTPFDYDTNAIKDHFLTRYVNLYVFVNKPRHIFISFLLDSFSHMSKYFLLIRSHGLRSFKMFFGDFEINFQISAL